MHAGRAQREILGQLGLEGVGSKTWARRRGLEDVGSKAWASICRKAIKSGNQLMEYYLVELDEHQLERLTGLVREAIKVADAKGAQELEALLAALGNVRWKAGDRSAD
jgi:hypothetical protein